MKSKQQLDSPQRPAPAKALASALGQSEHVKILVEESAEELSSVNTALKHEVAAHDARPAVESALQKSVGVETKVQDASAKLAVVNGVLKDEVRERHILEAQLAAATERGEADHHAALHDPLTGLPNRTLFSDRLEHGLAQATRQGWMLAVLFLDVNCFKGINDSLGHTAGDAVLRTIAARLKNATRADDTVSRFGGDEFLCLVMDPKTEADLAVLAEKIIKAIQVPCDVGDPQGTVNVNASLGISIFPKDGVTADALTKRADAAMYKAKRDGLGYAFA
jgi:diguanylate cyclase (GGDEF)-like protein